MSAGATRCLAYRALRFASAGPPLGHELVIPDVALRIPGNITTGAFDDDNAVDIGAALYGLVGAGL